MTKVELLVSLISMVEAPAAKVNLTEADLDKKIASLNKLENDEYMATLKGLVNLKRTN